MISKKSSYRILWGLIQFSNFFHRFNNDHSGAGKEVDLLAKYYCDIDSFQIYELVCVGQVVKLLPSLGFKNIRLRGNFMT